MKFDYIVVYAITFPLLHLMDLCMGKAHKWWTFPKNVGAELNNHLVLGPFILGMPPSYGFTLHI
jgi:hypothetical protein